MCAAVVAYYSAKVDSMTSTDAGTCPCGLQGTMDCILCRDTGLEDFRKALQVVRNNLKSPGVFVMVSHGTPDLRLHLLQQEAWESIQVIAPDCLF